MLPDQTDVLVVGAGPTGLALGIALAEAGVDHVIIDALPAGLNTSRAAVVHAHTLEALGSLGVTDGLVARGMPLPRFMIRDRDRRLLEIGFAELPSRFRSLLMVPQSTTEAVLGERLEALGGMVHRGVTALEVARLGDGATIRVRGEDGERQIAARYVVGADGMRSIVRAAAGIHFEGRAAGESFILADVRMDWPLRDEVSLFFSPAGLVVAAPLPDGSYRIVATCDEAPEHPDLALVQALLDSRGPQAAPARVREVVWSSRFHVHHRLAARYRMGPFLLMGDAAHVHSPAGGQGMNTGLVDAVVLGEALRRVVRDRAPDSVLDDYAALRRPAAAQVLGLAGGLTRMATMRPTPLRMLRNILLRLLDRAPRLKRRLAMNLSGLSRRSLATLPPQPHPSFGSPARSRPRQAQARPPRMSRRPGAAGGAYAVGAKARKG